MNSFLLRFNTNMDIGNMQIQVNTSISSKSSANQISFLRSLFYAFTPFFVNPKGNSDRIPSIVNGMCGVFRFRSVLVFLQCLPIQSKKEEKQGMNKK